MNTELSNRQGIYPSLTTNSVLVDEFVARLKDALIQVEPRVATEIKMLANLGLVVEAERLLIEYVVLDDRSYEIRAERDSINKSFRFENLLMQLWVTAMSECSTFGTFAACMSWVWMGS